MATNKKSSTDKKKPNNGTYAIVEASGKQFWLEPNRYYDLDRIKADINQTVSLEKVLLFNNEKETVIGKPYISGASVQLKVLEHRRGTKLIVYKMRPKKKTRRKSGHRQELTRVMVESISIGTKGSKAKTSVEEVKSEKSTKVKPENKNDAKTSTVKKVTKKVSKKAGPSS